MEAKQYQKITYFHTIFTHIMITAQDIQQEINEHFVPKHLVDLLRALGLTTSYIAYWNDYIVGEVVPIDFRDLVLMNRMIDDGNYTGAPMWSQVWEWFRHKHKLDVRLHTYFHAKFKKQVVDFQYDYCVELPGFNNKGAFDGQQSTLYLAQIECLRIMIGYIQSSRHRAVLSNIKNQ